MRFFLFRREKLMQGNQFRHLVYPNPVVILAGINDPFRMKYLITVLTLVLLLVASEHSFSNDGAYRASGNQLIPVYETNVSVKKEILSIRRINKQFAAITVYYEFFNPGKGKEVLVGFEAAPPSGDVDGTPTKGEHPYISKFTVNLNGLQVPYNVAYVKDSLYYKNGKIRSISLGQAMEENAASDEPSFFYVYHFKANFKEGLNVLTHTYIVELSNSVEEIYSLTYILSAAGRWANRQIDDFTLNIDMGEFQDISIKNTFFKKNTDWQLTGSVKTLQEKSRYEAEDDAILSRFIIRNGSLSFSRKNFKPKGELYMKAFNTAYYRNSEYSGSFNCKHDHLPYPIEDQEIIPKAVDEASRRVLKNLPFARRGYIFKAPDLQAYFEKQVWYSRDDQYRAELNSLTAEEKKWLSTL